MANDRLNRGDRGDRGALDAEHEVDWMELARDRGVAIDDARRLFDRACELVSRRGGNRSDIARVYQRLLDQSIPRAPGRMTRTLRLESLQSTAAPRRGRAAPGKVALTSYLAGRADRALRERLHQTFGDDAPSGVALFRDVPEVVSAGLPLDDSAKELDPTLRLEQRPGQPGVSGRAAPLPHFDLPGAREGMHALPPLQAPGGGEQARPLQPDVAARMGRLLDVDLGGVMVVPESPAVTGSTKAVTQDNEVRFRPGAYQPGTVEGDWLIAHELAHVAQQRGGRGERSGTRTELEREADRAAALVGRGRAAPIALRADRSAAYAFNEGEAHDTEVDDAADQQDVHADRDRTAARPDDTENAQEPKDPAEAAAHTAPAHEPPAAEDPDAGAGAADSGMDVDAVVAVLPAEDSPAGPPAVGGGAPAKPPKEAPSIAAAKPEVGLAQLRGVRPDRLTQLFGPVHSAAGADVAQERTKLQANPPRQMSTGAAAAAAAGDGAKGRPAKNGTPGAGADPKAAGDPKAAADPKAHELPDHLVKIEVPGGQADKQAQQGQAAEQQKSAPQMIASAARSISSWLSSWFGHGDTGNTGDSAKTPKMSEAETRQMSGSLDQLPTTAQGVATDAGPSPSIAMTGEAKDSASRDRAKLETTTAGLETQGRADSRAPMGEDHIEPAAAPEELTATSVPGGGAPADAALPTVAGASPSEEVGIVAQEQHGPEIDAAVTKASADAKAERAKHTQEEQQARTESDAHLRELKTRADADHAAARTAAQAEVQQARGQWQSEIDKKGSEARKQADRKVADGTAQVEAEQARANAEARQHIDEGKRKAEDEKQKGEKEAADAKDKGKQKSSGFFGWLASKAKAAFDGIKKAVSAAIDACRKAVKAVIDAAKKLAMAAIDLARKVIVAAIKAVGAALIAISSVLLAAFPGLKARFQGLIKRAVDKAVATVNRLADGLKKAVQKALDGLGAALDKALGLLEKGLDAIIDAANAVVQGAIKAAQAVVEALGTWAKLLKDIVTAPGAWLGKLGSAVVDGIKHHLWSAFKTAVVDWFKSKVFELLGVGGILLELLLEGGLTRDHIIQMALDALMVAIPAALVAILIEKLVSMIVPAAGAVIAVIEGLQAAWGTISRIIAAFSAFMAFLLAVKGGGAGALFAAVLASAAVVVLDFVANWLLKKLMSAARKVGAKLKGLAEKFKSKRKAKKDAKSGHSDQKQKPKHEDDHDRAEKERRQKEEKDKKNQEILAKAQAELPPKIRAALAKGTRGITLRARLAMWRVQYRLTSLNIIGSGDRATIVAKVNPEATLLDIMRIHRDELLMYVREIAQQARERAKPEAAAAMDSRKTVTNERGTEIDTIKLEHPVSPFGVAETIEQAGDLRYGTARDVYIGEGRTRLTGGSYDKATGQRVSEFTEEGKHVNSGGKYHELAARYKGKGAELAEAIELYRRSGKVRDGFTKNELTAMIVLMEGLEAGPRSTAAGVQTAKALDLLKNGTPIEDILGRDVHGGLHPMSPAPIPRVPATADHPAIPGRPGAVEQARAADRYLDPERTRKPGQRISKNALAHMEREIQLLHAWVNTLDLVFGDTASEREKIDEIKKAIRTRILGL